jgi:hypothetical protein
MAIDKGQALVSVADVAFFDTTSGAFLGEGLALTNSSLVQEVQAMEQRGGYLNALLFNIKHSKNVTVEIESATFKMEYLAFQTGTPIITGLDNVYKFDECVTFTNGTGVVSGTPVGNVFVRMPNGTIATVTPTGSTVNTGESSFNGQANVMYQYNTNVQKVTIDTKTQPLTVKAVLKVHAFSQEKEIGTYEITVPRLKFNGSINLNLASDAVSTFGLGGTALEIADDCGSSYYAEVKFIPLDDADLTAVVALCASPNTYSFSLAGTKTATVTILGIRNGVYANTILANAEVTFVSAAPATATVNSAGLITGVAQGSTTITATYQGLQEIISVTVGA